MTNLIWFNLGWMVTWTAGLRPRWRRRRTTHVYREATRGTDLLLDLYHPGGDGPVPVLVWIHGGGWVLGHRRVVPPAILGQIDRGYAVVSPTYRFLQQAKWPAQLDDVAAAVAWVRANGAAVGLDPGRMVVGGESAGGHLAAMAALTEAEAPPAAGGPSSIRGVAAWFAPTDLRALTDGSPFQRAMLRFMVGRRSDPVADQFAAISPIDHIVASAPPFLLFHGTWDLLVPWEQSPRFQRALIANGVSAGFESADHYVHIDPRFNRRRHRDRLEDFLDDRTGSLPALLDPAPVPAPAMGRRSFGRLGLGRLSFGRLSLGRLSLGRPSFGRISFGRRGAGPRPARSLGARRRRRH